MSSILYKEIENTFSIISKPTIPKAICDNIKQPLREYQIKALENFIFYNTDKKYKDKDYKHLLFHMATGSGKTNIIASSILYLYSKGYRDFIFFVNTINIITKTKENLINRYSSKYLFKDKIIINNKEVNINLINDSFISSKKENINILFTTTHKLHNDLETSTKENSITYTDFKNRKLVLIADEAHHLNSELKKKKNKEDRININGWGTTTKNILKTNKENILLEFTATAEINSSIDIANHYENKIICEYPLIKFRNDKYSKDIKLISDNLTQNQRILQAILISEYRQIVAMEQLNQAIKPVIMFKNPKGIKNIDKNFRDFVDLIENLKIDDITEIFEVSNIKAIKKLKNKFENISDLINRLKYSFSKDKCLIIYSTSADKQEKLKLLNYLEDINNPIRAIFAVNVLNEGWDVLNLFDIVKLDETKTNTTNTTSEAQLIGRGARYFPFKYKNENRYKRKFDKYPNKTLRILEEMYFYSINKNEYIKMLKKELTKIGLLDEIDKNKKIILELKDDFLENRIYKNSIVQSNTTILGIRDYIGDNYKIQNINIDNSSNEINIINEKLEEKKFLNPITFKLKDINKYIIRSAINKKPFYYFSNLKKYFKNLKSIDEFINNDNYLANIKFNISFTKKQNLKDSIILKLILDLLDEISMEIERCQLPHHKW